MNIVEQNTPVTVVGLELRTTNERAFEEIPQHWQTFFRDGVAERIPDKLSGDIYAVYTRFENPGKNNHGPYSFVIGAAVRNTNAIPAV